MQDSANVLDDPGDTDANLMGIPKGAMVVKTAKSIYKIGPANVEGVRAIAREGKPLPFRETAYTLGTAQVLLMSDYSPKSFDGRYFGPIDQTGIKGVLRPVFTIWFPAKGTG